MPVINPQNLVKLQKDSEHVRNVSFLCVSCSDITLDSFAVADLYTGTRCKFEIAVL